MQAKLFFAGREISEKRTVQNAIDIFKNPLELIPGHTFVLDENAAGTDDTQTLVKYSASMENPFTYNCIRNYN